MAGAQQAQGHEAGQEAGMSTAIDAERAMALLKAIADACAAVPRGEPPEWMVRSKMEPEMPAYVSFGTDATVASLLVLAGGAVDVEDRPDHKSGICRQRTAHLRVGQALLTARWPARILKAVEEDSQ